VDHAHADRRVRLARLGIAERGDLRIQPARVVDQVEHRDAGRVELPVGDPLAVGTPAETVPQVELLFVDPVAGPVDDRLRAVVRQLHDLQVADVLDVQIVLANVGDLAAVGRELREHQRRGRRIAAQLLQSPVGRRQHPVVAARVGAPDPLRVGEDQQPLAVVGPSVAIDAQGLGLSLGNELLGGHENVALACLRIVSHDVLGLVEVVGVLQRGVARAVLEPAGRTEGLGLEVVRIEDPLDGENGWIVRLSGRERPFDQDQNCYAKKNQTESLLHQTIPSP